MHRESSRGWGGVWRAGPPGPMPKYASHCFESWNDRRGRTALCEAPRILLLLVSPHLLGLSSVPPARTKAWKTKIKVEEFQELRAHRLENVWKAMLLHFVPLWSATVPAMQNTGQQDVCTECQHFDISSSSLICFIWYSTTFGYPLSSNCLICFIWYLTTFWYPLSSDTAC